MASLIKWPSPFLINLPSLDNLAIGASLQSKAPSRQSVRVPCEAFPDKARLCPSSAPTTLTLAMKSQKPCSERWPQTAPSAQPRCASNAASERTTACCQPLRFPDGSSPTSLRRRSRSPSNAASARDCPAPTVAAAPSSAKRICKS